MRAFFCLEFLAFYQWFSRHKNSVELRQLFLSLYLPIYPQELPWNFYMNTACF